MLSLPQTLTGSHHLLALGVRTFFLLGRRLFFVGDVTRDTRYDLAAAGSAPPLLGGRLAATPHALDDRLVFLVDVGLGDLAATRPLLRGQLGVRFVFLVDVGLGDLAAARSLLGDCGALKRAADVSSQRLARESSSEI